MDAGALSAALYGDREHLVTVRAEMSRLRRTPAGSTAPGIRRLLDAWHAPATWLQLLRREASGDELGHMSAARVHGPRAMRADDKEENVQILVPPREVLA